MEAIFPYPLGFRDLGINRIHPPLLFQSHMKTTIEERDILDPFQLC